MAQDDPDRAQNSAKDARSTSTPKITMDPGEDALSPGAKQPSLSLFGWIASGCGIGGTLESTGIDHLDPGALPPSEGDCCPGRSRGVGGVGHREETVQAGKERSNNLTQKETSKPFHDPKLASAPALVCSTSGGAVAGGIGLDPALTDIDVPQWRYRDPEGKAQGPFSGRQLYEWRAKLPSQLEVWQDVWRGGGTADVTSGTGTVPLGQIVMICSMLVRDEEMLRMTLKPDGSRGQGRGSSAGRAGWRRYAQ